MMSTGSLGSLVLRAREGDENAYGVIVRRFQDMAVGYGYSILFCAISSCPKTQLRKPLHYVAGFGFVDLVEPLLNRGADLDARDDEGRTPVEVAVEAGQAEMVEMLRLRATPGTKNQESEVEMEAGIARIAGIALMMGLLSPLISHANQEDGGMDTKEFLNAVTSGEALKVKEWVKKDRALANATDEKGVSAILLAVYYRKAEVVDVLLSFGLELNIFEAAATGQTERVRKLLKKDPDLVNAFAPDGFYPLGLAIFFGHTECATLLLTSGADVNMAAKNDLKVMPLHAAAAAKQLDAARMLIKRGAEVNAAHQAGYTALHAVASTGQLEFAELLLVSGADVNAKTDAGKTALTFAVEAGEAEMASLLRKHGARQ